MLPIAWVTRLRGSCRWARRRSRSPRTSPGRTGRGTEPIPRGSDPEGGYLRQNVISSYPLPIVELKHSTNLPCACSSYRWIMYKGSNVYRRIRGRFSVLEKTGSAHNASTANGSAMSDQLYIIQDPSLNLSFIEPRAASTRPLPHTCRSLTRFPVVRLSKGWTVCYV